MDEVHVWRVEAVDGKTVAGLARLIPQVSASAPPVVESSLDSLLADGMTSIFVAERNGEIVGTASLVVLHALSGDKGHVEDFAVDESTRRAGVGTSLMAALIAHGRALGLRYVDLTSRPSREAANAFYQAFGFERRDTNVYRCTLAEPSDA